MLGPRTVFLVLASTVLVNGFKSRPLIVPRAPPASITTGGPAPTYTSTRISSLSFFVFSLHPHPASSSSYEVSSSRASSTVSAATTSSSLIAIETAGPSSSASRSSAKVSASASAQFTPPQSIIAKSSTASFLSSYSASASSPVESSSAQSTSAKSSTAKPSVAISTAEYSSSGESSAAYSTIVASSTIQQTTLESSSKQYTPVESSYSTHDSSIAKSSTAGPSARGSSTASQSLSAATSSVVRSSSAAASQYPTSIPSYISPGDNLYEFHAIYSDIGNTLVNTGGGRKTVFSIEGCLAYCAIYASPAPPVTYAGIRDFDQCYCSSSLETSGANAGNVIQQGFPPTSDRCTGDKYEYCGNASLTVVYSIRATPLQSADIMSPSIPAGDSLYAFSSAWIDGLVVPLLNGLPAPGYITSPQMSVQFCFDICRNGSIPYNYCGLENGSECYCGNSLNTAGGNDPTSNNDITIQCVNDAYEYCGGTNIIQLYSLSSLPSSSSNALASPTSTSAITSQGASTSPVSNPSSQSTLSSPVLSNGGASTTVMSTFSPPKSSAGAAVSSTGAFVSSYASTSTAPSGVPTSSNSQVSGSVSSQLSSMTETMTSSSTLQPGTISSTSTLSSLSGTGASEAGTSQVHSSLGYSTTTTSPVSSESYTSSSIGTDVQSSASAVISLYPSSSGSETFGAGEQSISTTQLSASSSILSESSTQHSSGSGSSYAFATTVSSTSSSPSSTPTLLVLGDNNYGVASIYFSPGAALLTVMGPFVSSVENCLAYCVDLGCQFAGIQDFGQCYCGTVLMTTGTTIQPDYTQATTPCIGNFYEYCGTSSYMVVYELRSTPLVYDTPTIPPGDSLYSYSGAYSQPGGAAGVRILQGLNSPYTYQPNVVSVQACLDYCSNPVNFSPPFKFVGVEDGMYCLCGDTLELDGGTNLQVSDGNAQTKCLTDDYEICGGFEVMLLYQLRISPNSSSTLATTSSGVLSSSFPTLSVSVHVPGGLVSSSTVLFTTVASSTKGTWSTSVQMSPQVTLPLSSSGSRIASSQQSESSTSHTESVQISSASRTQTGSVQTSPGAQTALPSSSSKSYTFSQASSTFLGPSSSHPISESGFPSSKSGFTTYSTSSTHLSSFGVYSSISSSKQYSASVPSPETGTSERSSHTITASTSVAVLSSSAAVTSSVPSEAPITIIIAIEIGSFVVNQPDPGTKRKRQQADSSDSFIITGNATNSMEGCSNAATFTIEDGLLETSTGLVETNLTSTFQIFDVSPYIATYTRTWVYNGNALNWNNPAFGPNETAYFCQQANGIIYILFNGDTDPSYPSDCVIVNLLSVPAQYCKNNTIVYPSATSSSFTLSIASSSAAYTTPIQSSVPFTTLISGTKPPSSTSMTYSISRSTASAVYSSTSETQTAPTRVASSSISQTMLSSQGTSLSYFGASSSIPGYSSSTMLGLETAGLSSQTTTFRATPTFSVAQSSMSSTPTIFESQSAILSATTSVVSGAQTSSPRTSSSVVSITQGSASGNTQLSSSTISSAAQLSTAARSQETNVAPSTTPASQVSQSTTNKSSSPISTSTSGLTSAPTGATSWVYIGCYGDDVNARILTTRLYLPEGPGAMTNPKCHALCEAANFVLSGTEFFSECYCGNSFSNGGTLASDGEANCNDPCDGDHTQICGGSNRLSVYRLVRTSGNAPISTTSSTTSAMQTTSGAGTETSSKLASSATSDTVSSSSSEIISSNFNLSGYSTSSAETTGIETRMGETTYTKTSTPVASISQRGKQSTTSATNTYVLPSTHLIGTSTIPSATPTINPGNSDYGVMGCYDSGDDNVAYVSLTQIWSNSTHLDVDTCLAYCAAGAPGHGPPYDTYAPYTYAILEYHGDTDTDWCYCTNDFPDYKGGSVDSSLCNSICAGNMLEFCGGYHPDSTGSNLGPNYAEVYSLRSHLSSSTTLTSHSAIFTTLSKLATGSGSSDSDRTTIIPTTITSRSNNSPSPTQTPPPQTDGHDFIIGIQLGDTGDYKAGAKFKRQSGTQYIGPAGSTSNCNEATVFTLSKGHLSIGSRLISTNPFVALQPFGVFDSDIVGAITETFIDSNNHLFWLSPEFADGMAFFCQLVNGFIEVLFDGENSPAYPPCYLVSLLLIPVNSCKNNIVTSFTGQGECTGIIPRLPAPTLFTRREPNMVCSAVAYSFIPGETTFAPMPTH